MDLATTITIVTGTSTTVLGTFLGSMYFITNQIGQRITSLEHRVDGLEARITRLEEAVTVLREDVAVLKATH